MKAKYLIDTEENRRFLREIREGLLAFGHRFPSPDGSSYYLGDDGMPWTDRPRETWVTSRMAHVYSIGTLLGHEGSEALADAALKGLRGALHDNAHQGWYAGLTADGGILPTKQCYAHAFVILAATSTLLAGRPARRSFWRTPWLSTTAFSGMRRRAYPAIPGIPSLPCRTTTGG